MAKHRPINERMAELQAQMVALQTKQNKEAVNADPKVRAIDAEINDLNNKISHRGSISQRIKDIP